METTVLSLNGLCQPRSQASTPSLCHLQYETGKGWRQKLQLGVEAWNEARAVQCKSIKSVGVIA